MDQRDVTMFADVYNFRDLGGYQTLDNRFVRWKRLFRSDSLSRVTESEHPTFRKLGVRTVVDLRRPEEIARDGRLSPIDTVTYHNLVLQHPIWPDVEFADTAERADYVAQRYLEMCQDGYECIGDALRLIADDSTAPLVFHCASGKDRTGVIAALTLSLLGVDDDTIADDYQLSERAEPAAWALLTRSRPELTEKRWLHFTVNPREGMLTVLRELRRKHRSVEGYAAAIGVTAAHVAAMREHLLTDSVIPAQMRTPQASAPQANAPQGGDPLRAARP